MGTGWCPAPTSGSLRKDVAEDEEKLDMMLDLDGAVGGAGDGAAAGAAASAPPPPSSGAAAVGAAGDGPGQSFASLCETVIAKAAIAIGLSPVANNSATDVGTLQPAGCLTMPHGSAAV